MSSELIVAIVTAGMSAAASIIAALIQAGGKGKETPTPVGAARAEPDLPAAPVRRRGLTSVITRFDFGEAPTGKKGVDGVWLAVVLLMAVEAIALGTREAEFSALLNSVILIPVITFVLALARPIGWGYAAGAVTLLHAIVFVAAQILTRGRWEHAPQIFLLAFVANALLVGGVAFLRTRAKPAALGGTLVAAGVGALVWLFVPMLVPMGARPPEPHEPHEAELRRDRERAEMERERARERDPHRPVRIDPDAIRVRPGFRPEVERVEPVTRPSRTIKLRWTRPEMIKRVRPEPEER